MDSSQVKIEKDGIILVNKPKGVTSHDVVDMVRHKLGMRRVGHAGTLDPLAEGLLVVLVGKSTKLFSKFVGFDKEYSGIMKLGEVTSTGDSLGVVTKTESCEKITEKEIRDVFATFHGDMDQIPPMVSALRVKGKRLYELARKGLTVERAARKIKIYEIVINKIEMPYVEFYVRCSKGTYVRQIAEDIGAILKCGAHMTKILRLSIGPFKLEDAVNPENVDDKSLQKFSA